MLSEAITIDRPSAQIFTDSCPVMVAAKSIIALVAANGAINAKGPNHTVIELADSRRLVSRAIGSKAMTATVAKPRRLTNPRVWGRRAISARKVPASTNPHFAASLAAPRPIAAYVDLRLNALDRPNIATTAPAQTGSGDEEGSQIR